VYVELLMARIEEHAADYLSKPAVMALGIADENGNIDLDRIHDAAVKRMTSDRI